MRSIQRSHHTKPFGTFSAKTQMKSCFTTYDLPETQEKQIPNYLLEEDIDREAANSDHAVIVVVFTANGLAIAELESISRVLVFKKLQALELTRWHLERR
jgi:hypothetical protein